MNALVFSSKPLDFELVKKASFHPEWSMRLSIEPETLERVKGSQKALLSLLESEAPIYGVSTGFGEGSHRNISPSQALALQANLVSYLLCGSGEALPKPAVRAMMIFRLQSLSRGLSGVSTELLERLALFIEKDFVPVIPSQGSLGASGDLIPLAYLARVLEGQGEVFGPNGTPVAVSPLLAASSIPPYTLKPKEGLALVNGTSAMAGACLYNLMHAERIVNLATTASAWCCLAISGHKSAFSALVNQTAKSHPGQAHAAKRITQILEAQSYEGPKLIRGEAVQDRYSLRCAPQILGPVMETIELAEKWLKTEADGVSDNPLITSNGELAMGGNFYGGYLAHGMDYLKISLAHVADMLDRQLLLVMDPSTSRGLPPNVADPAPEEKNLHHGLKGLHQALNALTSEIMSSAGPVSTFSRSSESHNQDKVSLGMSAANQARKLIDHLYTALSLDLICLAQALDLKNISLKDPESHRLYAQIRKVTPKVTRDQAMDSAVNQLKRNLMDQPFGVAL